MKMVDDKSQKKNSDKRSEKTDKDGIRFDVDIRVKENEGNITGVHIENLFMEQKTEAHAPKNPIEINMIFGTTAKSYEEIQKAKIEDNPMIIFFLSNKGRLLHKLRGPYALNEKDEEVLLFPCEWIDLEYGAFRQIGTKNLDLLDRYRRLWFENPEGDKFFVPEEAWCRVSEEIAEFRDKKTDEHSKEKGRISFNRSHVLSILQALVTHRDADISFKNGCLFLNGDRPIESPHPFSDDGMKERIDLLAKHAGFPNVHSVALVQSWTILLFTKEKVSCRELIEAGKKAASWHFEKDPVLGKWRDAVERRLFSAIPTLASAERFTGDASAPEQESSVELMPLLHDWPHRLLTHRDWAYAEAPLPEIAPMSLDDVWVDVQFVDPLEMGSFALGETMLESMERRYEERQWLSEPALFILERFRGSAALIGAPGIGKTTLLKWLARQMIYQTDGRFLLPLFVSLRRYVLDKSEDKDLLSFAIRQCGITHPSQVELWGNRLAYLSGTEKNTVLLMLDGWDEVPAPEREALLREIDTLAHAFAILITSRPSAYPLSLPVDRFYEITELSPESIHMLIRQWFNTAGRPEYADHLLRHLDVWPDLRRLSRNPFLLNLICGVSFTRIKGKGGRIDELPTSRTALYRQTIDRITAHHSQRYPDVPFDAFRKRQTERLAFWLMAEAPQSPRFVFDEQDVADCCDDPEFLPKVLQPSRMLSQWDLQNNTLHFLHTTIHEYLAACSLLREPTGRLFSHIRSHAYDDSWREIFRFVAGNRPDAQGPFWREMRRIAQHPDRFGHVYIRLAHLMAEAGVDDGGKTLLETDVREQLWEKILNESAPNQFVDAFIELDAADYVERVGKFATGKNEQLKARLLRSLNRVRTAESSRILVEKLLSGDPNASAVAGYAVADVLDTCGRQALRNALHDSDVSPSVKKTVIRALGHAKDYESVGELAEIAREDSSLAKDALYALSRIGGHNASSVLADMLIHLTEDALKAQIINALGEMRNAKARDTLIMHLAVCAPDDPQVPNILDALCENPISTNARIITEFLGPENDESVRKAAAWALTDAGESGVTDALAKTAREDESGAVRIAALGALRKQARPYDISWLSEVVRDERRDILERTNALEAVFMAISRYLYKSDVMWMNRLFPVGKPAKLGIELALAALREPKRDLTFTAASRAYLLGEGIAPRLTEICADNTFPYDVREAAITSLGKLKFQGAVDALFQLIRLEPDVPDDEELPLTNQNQRLARAAAEAVAMIDAALLLHEPGSAARHALRRYSLNTGNLVFADCILDSGGRTNPL